MQRAPAPASPLRRAGWLFLAACALSVGMALVQSARGENLYGNAGWCQVEQAHALLDGLGFGRVVDGTFYPGLFLRPVYSLVLAPFAALAGGDWQVLRALVALLQGALLAGTGLGLAGVLRRAGAETAARIAPWLVITHPILVSQASAVTDTIVFLALFCGSYALLDRAVERRTAGSFGLAGAVFGLAVLTRSTAVTLGPALLRRGLELHGGWRARARAAGVFVLVAAALLAPWIVRNHGLTGRVMLSTVSGVNLWMGNSNQTASFLDVDRSLDELPGRHRFDSLSHLRIEDQLASYDAAREEVSRFLRERPGEAAVLAIRKAGDLWTPLVRPRSTRSRMGPVKDVVSALWWGPMMLLAGVGLVRAARRGGRERRLAVDVVVTALAFTAPHALAWGGTRLRAPLDPLLLVLTALGAAVVIERWRRFRAVS